MPGLNFDREHAIEAIRLAKKNGRDWLYASYPKPNGQMRKSSTGFLMHGGEAYPVKPLGRLASYVADNPMVDNPITNVFRRHFEKLGFRLIELLEDESEAAAERQRRLAQIWERPGQAKFRREVFALFGARCLVSGCETLEALEAAHIQPVSRGGCDEAWNGLPLRADLHRLFDANIIGFEPGTLKLTVMKSQRRDYGQYDGLDLAPVISKVGNAAQIVAAMHKRLTDSL